MAEIDETQGTPGESPEAAVVPEADPTTVDPAALDDTAGDTGASEDDAEAKRREEQSFKDKYFKLLEERTTAKPEATEAKPEPEDSEEAIKKAMFASPAYGGAILDAYEELKDIETEYGKDSAEWNRAAKVYNRVYARTLEQFRDVYDTKQRLDKLQESVQGVTAQTIGKQAREAALAEVGVTADTRAAVDAEIAEAFGVNILEDPNLPPEVVKAIGKLAAKAAGTKPAKPATPAKPTSVIATRSGDPAKATGGSPTSLAEVTRRLKAQLAAG